MFNSDLSLDSYERTLHGVQEIHSPSFAGVSQNIDIFNQQKQTDKRVHDRERTQVRYKPFIFAGKTLHLQEEEAPIHPALELANRNLESDEYLNRKEETPRTSPSLFLKQRLPTGKKENCVDRLKTLENFKDSLDTECATDSTKHIEVSESGQHGDGELIREELRKLSDFSSSKKTGFFQNYFNEHGIGTEWLQNISTGDSDKENRTNNDRATSELQDYCNVTNEQHAQNHSSKCVQESGFHFIDAEFPSLPNSFPDSNSSKPLTSVGLATTQVSFKQSGGTSHSLPDIDLGNGKYDIDDVGWTSTSVTNHEEELIAIQKPKEDSYEAFSERTGLQDESVRCEGLDTAKWVTSLDEGAVAKTSEEWTMEPNCCVVIRNVPDHVCEAQLFETLGVYGEVVSVTFCNLQEHMKCAIVEMLDTTQADELVDMFQEVQLFGNPLNKPITTVYYNEAF